PRAPPEQGRRLRGCLRRQARAGWSWSTFPPSHCGSRARRLSAHPVLAFDLCLPERTVGAGEHRVGCHLVFIARGAGADANGDSYRSVADGEALFGDRVADALGGEHRGALAGFRHDDDEFLAAEADHHIGLAYALADGRRDLFERDVADEMAVNIVVGLEVVQVDHQAGEVAPVAAGAVSLAIEAPAPYGAVNGGGALGRGCQGLQVLAVG